MCVTPNACGSQKNVLDPLKLEVQAIVSWKLNLGPMQGTLLTAEPTLYNPTS